MMKAIVIVSLIAVGSATLLGKGYGGGILIGDPLAKPTPYAFGYDTTDEYGTTMTRQESGDGSGAAKGSYSYKDAQGLTRVVTYVADAGGFRATVKTNEPGTETSRPADVDILANPVIVAPKLIAPRPILAYGKGLY